MSTSRSITFKRDPANQPKNVTLVIKDYSTDAIVAGASVTVTGPNAYSFNGTSGSDGKVTLGNLPAGQYTLVATAGGYQPSATDFLANDKFTV